MKKMTCKELGGACELIFEANTFAEISELSKKHGAKMFAENNEPHLQAMQEMTQLMQTPEAMQEWFNQKKAIFEALPNT